ncbi:DUF2254 domain-containing protein [Neptunomonas antarctica]|uniref:Uncharacterized membrane protein n=1 Tax=Neptunomonas antarctica TaxID=619304 RepID=A0A1N7LHE4_9GAMM|nr:DUF2254 domain-containing protein [Neptunomonas antarctica]SIS73240.1 Uncharacterized membrane protein [Neptunomonas antarctica]
MSYLVSIDRLRFKLNRFSERLWVKPMFVCLLSVVAALVAKLADSTLLTHILPTIAEESIETLLSIMAASMLVIATFSVSSMVSAYASASSTATPRSFTLVMADDTSQNALSTFVGAFIFSIVALTAVKNHYFDTAGLFILFVLTAIVFSMVIITFVYWVDCIARLGRLGSTVEKVERTTARAFELRQTYPTLRCAPVTFQGRSRPVFAPSIGYVQHIDVSALQAWAEQAQVQIIVAALPGMLATPDKALAYISGHPCDQTWNDCKKIAESFQIGRARLFDDDPRFGLVVLSEIAGRALSPAVNDPGTAIDIIGTLLRLFIQWNEPILAKEEQMPKYDRVEMPELSVHDMFDDAFTSIARDGASTVEVSVRLQKALQTLASVGDAAMRDAAKHHAKMALERSRISMQMKDDLAAAIAAGSK